MSSLTCIGIHAHAEPDRLLATLASVRAHTPPDVDLVLLPDGPDRATAASIGAHPELRVLPRLGTDQPHGPPTCFNRLAAFGDAATLVLLESGSIVGPEWLTLLVGALEQPGIGLAGPSTNRSWNEQQLFPQARGTLEDVVQTSNEVRRRFGSSHRSLGPLYSLADFCFAVRRDVIETIGAADEVYGLGPCWEMDYNIRAARAGFAGAFVPGAYVFRHPMTSRRRLEESRRFEASRHLYQDRFCGLRLRGTATGYQPLCRGDACEHFAPPALITVALAPPERPQAPAPSPTPQAARESAPVHATPDPTSPATSSIQWPLVSALMPTRDRPDLAAQAVRYLLAQDYANVELVIVDDGPPGLGDYLPQDPRIRHIHTGLGRSVGAMRNHACALARGQILVQWDDDDWHGPQRLSRQATPIIEGRADITALRDSVMLDLPAWQFWMCDPELHRRLFVRDVHGGTLMFHRRVWERMSRYPDASLAEDAAFLDQAVRRGCRLEAISAGGLFVYVRHEGNTWRFCCGESVDPRLWSRVDEPPLPDADRAFYMIRSRRATLSRPTTTPLVSCIMPTHNRRPFVSQAIAYFLRQDYPAKELVVIDDGDDPIADLIPRHDCIRYRRLDRRIVLGAKRNLACDMADGSIVVHWDDDDWMALNRLTVQVRGLLREGIDVSGVSKPLFYDPAARTGWLFAYPGTERPWVAGASLCYRKELWSRSRFPEIANGEDTSFTWGHPAKALCDLSGDNCLVEIIHGANTSSKSPTGAYWRSRPAVEVETLLGPDLAFYHDLASSTRRYPAKALPGSTFA